MSAWTGAVALMFGWISLGPGVSERLPFDSPVIGGIALMLVVAMPMSLLFIVARCESRRTRVTALVAGALLVGWIIVELVFIREFSWFHPLYVALGVVVILVGRRHSASSSSNPWSKPTPGRALSLR